MAAAQNWFERLMAMYEQDTPVQADPYSSAKSTVGWAIRSMVDAVGPKDPARALKLARRLNDKTETGKALLLAGQYQSRETALKTWREAYSLLEDDQQTGYLLPRLAGMMYDLDPAQGKVFFDQLLQNNANAKQIISYAGKLNAGALAAPLARYKPAVSWLILQNAWAANIKNPQQQGQDQVVLAEAMSAVDFDQAMNWARYIPGKVWGSPRLDPSIKYQAQYGILQKALESSPKHLWTHFDVY